MPENTLFSFRVDLAELDAGAPPWLRSEERVSIERDCLGRHLLNEKGPGWPNLSLVGSAWSEEQLLFHFYCWASDSRQGRDTVVIVIQPESVGTSVKLEIDSQGRCVDAHVLRAGVGIDLKWESKARIEIVQGDSGKSWKLCVSLPLGVVSPPWSVAPPEAGAVWRLNLARVIEMGKKPSTCSGGRVLVPIRMFSARLPLATSCFWIPDVETINRVTISC